MTDQAPFKDRDDILPGDARPLERAIADTDGRLDDIDADFVRRIGGPDISAVPTAFLPARASARSVDIWDPAWPEDVQRRVIEVAPLVHAKKGTPFAVRTALDALKISTVIVQWWQTVPRGAPYTFKVTAYARAKIYDGDFILDPRLLAVAFATVMRTKPHSRAFAFAVGAHFGSGLGVAAIATARGKHRAAVRAQVDTAFHQNLSLAAIAAGRNRHRAVIRLVYPS